MPARKVLRAVCVQRVIRLTDFYNTLRSITMQIFIKVLSKIVIDLIRFHISIDVLFTMYAYIVWYIEYIYFIYSIVCNVRMYVVYVFMQYAY